MWVVKTNRINIIVPQSKYDLIQFKYFQSTSVKEKTMVNKRNRDKESLKLAVLMKNLSNTNFQFEKYDVSAMIITQKNIDLSNILLIIVINMTNKKDNIVIRLNL